MVRFLRVSTGRRCSSFSATCYFTVIDPIPSFQENADMFLFIDNRCHLTRHGHRLMAGIIARAIEADEGDPADRNRPDPDSRLQSGTEEGPPGHDRGSPSLTSMGASSRMG